MARTSIRPIVTAIAGVAPPEGRGRGMAEKAGAIGDTRRLSGTGRVDSAGATGTGRNGTESGPDGGGDGAMASRSTITRSMSPLASSCRGATGTWGGGEAGNGESAMGRISVDAVTRSTTIRSTAAHAGNIGDIGDAGGEGGPGTAATGSDRREGTGSGGSSRRPGSIGSAAALATKAPEGGAGAGPAAGRRSSTPLPRTTSPGLGARLTRPASAPLGNLSSLLSGAGGSGAEGKGQEGAG